MNVFFRSLVATLAAGSAVAFSSQISSRAETLWPDVSTGEMGRLVSTKLVYEAGSSSVGLTGTGETLAPALSKTVRCPGTTSCILKFTVNFQVQASTPGTAFGLRAILDNVEAGDYYIGETGTTQFANFVHTAMKRVPPGSHSIKMKIVHGGNAQMWSHSAEYQLYKP